MPHKTFGLSKTELLAAAKFVEEYKVRLAALEQRFVAKLASLGYDVAVAKFAAAKYPGEKDIEVHVESDGKIARIVASGSTVMFVEFGTGITNRLHASGLFEHGTYGAGKGANPKGWIYKGEPGDLSQEVTDKKGRTRPGVYRTWGNPPAEAMWGAIETMASQIFNVWREVLMT